VNATRSLIKVGSIIVPRPSNDLRAEECDVIYRQLYQQLMELPFSNQHVTAEYIRELFDVDNMLYYVEPDYYLPRSLGLVPGFTNIWNEPDPLANSTVSNCRAAARSRRDVNLMRSRGCKTKMSRA
jgi:hypothetical protein